MTVKTGLAPTLSTSSRIAYLDGIRAIAILAVIGVHWLYPYTGIARGGYVGVDLFFVLSGYIITRIIWRRREAFSYGAFLRQRVRRLYPALLGVVIVVVPAAAVIGVLSWGQSLLGGVLALTQAGSIFGGINLLDRDPFGVTWSLSAEWIFYLLWPLLLMRFWRRPPAVAAAWTAGIAVALYAASLFTSGAWFYFGPTSRAAQLLLGGALALLLDAWQPGERVRTTVRVAVPVLVLLIAAWVLVGPIEYDGLYRFVGYPLATATAVALILEGRAWPGALSTRLLSLRALTVLGLASYSVYLWHTIPLTLLDKHLIHLPTDVLAGCGVGIAVTASAASYLLLERRFMRSRHSGRLRGRA